MKISVDTEIEEIAELRAAVAIIEDAIKRREDGEELTSEESQTAINTQLEEPQPVETQEPQSETPEPQQTEAPSPPEVDLSALSTSDYGERVENRSMDISEPQQSETPSQPEAPQQDNKLEIKNIIQTLKDKGGGSPIQMQDIINLAKEKSIGEDETRKLVSDLQSSSSI
tara:strand:- start:1901 stop:2410 length:510 start_codon:yes stop_codon:yes gene_type:complete